jgi:Ricin-type beta-trefoil lectin domain-like
MQIQENAGDNQKWRLVSVGGNWYNIQIVSSRLVLDVEHSSNDNRARVLQWPDNRGQNQEWEFIQVEDDGAANEGFLHLPIGPKDVFFKIGNRNSGKVLDVPSSSSRRQHANPAVR